MRDLQRILSLFHNKFNKFNIRRAQIVLNSTLKSHFLRKKVIIFSLCTESCDGYHNVSRKSVNH